MTIDTALTRRGALAGALGAGLVAAGGARAQGTWPSRPITWIVPFPAGGGTDAFARPLAQQMDGQLNARIVIDNRGGAGGTVGASAAAKAQPDGYTFFVGAAHHAIAPAIYPNLDYDLERSFVPIGMVARPPQVVVANPRKVTAPDLRALVADARVNPGKYTYGSAGNGSTHHLAGELFQMVTGTKMVHVPYRGAGPAMQDLVAGNIDLVFDGLGSSASQIAAGTIRALAVAAAERSPTIPNVPTAREAGVENYEVATWYALWAPRGTPQPIVERMTAEVARALDSPAVREAWARNGSDVPRMMGGEFAAFVTAEIARWGKVARDAGVKL